MTKRRQAAVLYDALSSDQFAAAHEEVSGWVSAQSSETLAQASPQMLLVLSSPLFTSSQSQIAALAIERRWPSYVHLQELRRGARSGHYLDGFTCTSHGGSSLKFSL